ncbi:hypothetical protein LCGC14_0604520 [marine sediment metagenome]|uniref:histidine kinase n=1 Tax=marine sediment metagenome TaxID=412755 RepID=A0A0F9R9M6_9ZZZZ|nr:MAG: Signal transduction histidine kinase [Candidatus Lokiarchaeum sp. GC14_75]
MLKTKIISGKQLLLSSNKDIGDNEVNTLKILTNLDIGYIKVDNEGIITKHNLTYPKIFGYDSSADLVGTKTLDYWLNPEEKEKIRRKLYKNGIVKKYIATAKRLDGKKIFLQINFQLNKNFNGNPISSERTFIDVTQRIMTEQRLKESGEKYRRLFESSTDGIVSTDMEGRLIDFNKAFLEMLGYSKEELLQLNFRDITPSKWHEMDDNLLFKQLSEGKGRGVYEKEYIRKDGTIFPINIRFWILNDEQGDPNIMWAIVRDITSWKTIDDERKELSELKTEFLRRASHELKTPLISIKGFSELILSSYKEELNPEVISNLTEIIKGCRRLQTIINDLLHASRLETIDPKPRLEEEDLTFLIKYCVNELKSVIVKRRHSVNLEVHDSLIARFEKEEIHDVISNLLINAIKYTPPNGKINIKMELLEDTVIISVSDNGIGFNQYQKNSIFKQFGKIERYGQGLDLGIDGTGLGLYISKRIVESHGGKIWMESEGINQGSTFYFSIPL